MKLLVNLILDGQCVDTFACYSCGERILRKSIVCLKVETRRRRRSWCRELFNIWYIYALFSQHFADIDESLFLRRYDWYQKIITYIPVTCWQHFAKYRTLFCIDGHANKRHKYGLPWCTDKGTLCSTFVFIPLCTDKGTLCSIFFLYTSVPTRGRAGKHHASVWSRPRSAKKGVSLGVSRHKRIESSGSAYVVSIFKSGVQVSTLQTTIHVSREVSRERERGYQIWMLSNKEGETYLYT